MLVIELGFPLVLDFTQPYGFDVQRTLPCRYWFGEKLRKLDRGLLQDWLAATVQALQAEIPGLGEVVSFDVKHIDAWLQENNERAYVTERYDTTKRLAGDSDCKLGVTRSTHQELPDGSTKEKKELIWGSGSGVAAATTADQGDLVLAEDTQPFNAGDVTYFRPLSQQAVVSLNQFPTHLTADAAFDAWYVYQPAALHGGIAAVPKNQHGHPTFEREPDGVPLCPKALRMHPTSQFAHPNGYRAQIYRCPLFFPEMPDNATCDHPQFQAAKGCIKHINSEPGGLMRITLDREGPLYHSVYTQRTACERINSQAKAPGIERPKVRNARSVSHLHTLIYFVIHVRAIQRAKTINDGLLSIGKAVRYRDSLHPSHTGNPPSRRAE